jgi:nucleoside-diphosphate-sugar epimerase
MVTISSSATSEGRSIVPAALIGHTGFIGSNLANQFPFDAFFNSKNIEDIADRSFDLLVVSGMPAAMWIANRDPAGDRAILDRLVGCLRRVRADRVVIISTVAVYPHPVFVDEETPIDPVKQTPYGRHRLMLEQAALDHFPRTLVVRLPALFGPGLKKNAVYDLVHNHEVHKVNPASVYQFYNTDWVWGGITSALEAGVQLVNFATEPMSVREVSELAFGFTFTSDPGTPPVQNDVRSRHAELFGGAQGYLYDRTILLEELRAFFQRERAGEARQ